MKISSLNRNLSSQKELRLEALLPLIGSMSFDPSPSDKQRTERKRRFLRVATYFTFCGPHRASTPQTSDTTRSSTSGITASATSAVAPAVSDLGKKKSLQLRTLAGSLSHSVKKAGRSERETNKVM